MKPKPPPISVDNHPVPIDPEVAKAVANLDAQQRDAFEERAGILEFDSGLPRIDAERRALADVQRQFAPPSTTPKP